MTIPQSGLYYVYTQVCYVVPTNSWCGSTLTLNGVAIAVNHASSQRSYNNGQTLYSATIQYLNYGNQVYFVSRTTAQFELVPPRAYLGVTRLMDNFYSLTDSIEAYWLWSGDGLASALRSICRVSRCFAGSYRKWTAVADCNFQTPNVLCLDSSMVIK
jgi:hypothetical protein